MVDFQPNGEPRLQVLDCGIVYSVATEREYQNLTDICLAFMKHDGLRAGQCLIDSSSSAKVVNAQEFCQSIQELVWESEKQSVFEHIGDYVSKICDLSRKHIVRLDPCYFKIAMALKVAEGISLAFNRDLDLVSKCIPIVAKAQALRAVGISNFPRPEDDPYRSIDSKTIATAHAHKASLVEAEGVKAK